MMSQYFLNLFDLKDNQLLSNKIDSYRAKSQQNDCAITISYIPNIVDYCYYSIGWNCSFLSGRAAWSALAASIAAIAAEFAELDLVLLLDYWSRFLASSNPWNWNCLSTCSVASSRICSLASFGILIASIQISANHWSQVTLG